MADSVSHSGAMRLAGAGGICIVVAMCLMLLSSVDTDPGLSSHALVTPRPEAVVTDVATVPPAPVDPDAIQTEADRRFAKDFDTLMATLEDCGIETGHLCHPGGCTVALHMPDEPFSLVLMTAKAWRVVGEDFTQNVLDMPKGSLPCSGAIQEFAAYGKGQKGDYGTTLPTSLGKIGCATMSRQPRELEGDALAQFEQDQDRRCETLALSLGAVSDTSFAEVRLQEQEDE